MLATFMQKWARRYIRITQPSRYSPHKRARLRAFFSDGVDKWHVSWAVEALPTLLHVSLFLFFVGLAIYLFSTNHVVFGAVVWWVALSSMAYLSITLLPIFRPNSPYIAPLSSPIWYLYGSMRYAVFKVLSFPTIGYSHLDPAYRFRRLEDHYYNQFFEDIGKTAEKVAWKQASEIDVRVLQSTFDAFDEAGAQEEFFAAIPGFFESKLVNLFDEHLTDDFRDKFRLALDRFLDRTLSLSSVSESVRSRRLVIGLDAARATLGFDGVLQILQDIINGRWPKPIQSVETVQSLRHWNNKNDKQFTPYVQRIVAQVVVDVRERDEGWISLVKAEFAVPDRDIRNYISHGNSVLLSILIHVARQALHTGSLTPWVLSSLSGFDIHDTLPGLQHAFCALWNDILFEARDQGEDNTYVKILRDVRLAYIDLHRGTDAVPTFTAAAYYFDPDLVQPRSYRHCNVVSHRQDLTVRTPVTSSFIIPPSPTQLSASPNALSQPPPSRRHRTPPHIDTQASTRPSPVADLAPISTQAPSISSSPVSESTRVAIPRDLDGRVPGKASNDLRQSAPSAAKITATPSIRSDDPSPQNHTNDSGESPHTPAAPSLTFQHPCPVPATITPFTTPDVGDNPDALQDATSSNSLSHPLEGNGKQDTIVPCAEVDISESPPSFNPIPGPIPIIIVSGPSSPPLVLSALFSDTTTAEPPSSSESVSIQPDHISHALPSPSSSPTTASFHDTDDINSAIPIALLHSEQTVLPAHDIVATTLQPD
jgi:hypothetical protein